jgi:GNAT superfamily N-acetyltransferase
MGLVQFLKRTGVGACVRRLLGLTPAKAAPAPLLRMLRKFHPGERLPPAAVLEPYRLLRAGPGDEGRWVDLLNASGEFGSWDRRRLHQEIGASLLAEGGVLAAEGDDLVGCASACFLDEHNPYAILMYVAVLPGRRGRGLGQALVWETMRIAQQERFPGMLLHTENHRLAAVRTYFQLGFLPRLGKGAAGERQWSDVLSRALLHGGE